MGTITISLEGFDPSGRVRPQIEAILETLQPGAADQHGLKEGILRIAGRHGLAALYEAFEVKSAGGTDEWGISWDGLGGKRTAEKLAMGLDPATTILIENGDLAASLWPEAANPGQVFNVDAAAGVVEVGTDVPYAGRHQEGFHSEKYGPVPARPIVPPSGMLHERAEQEMDDEIEEWLSGRLVELLQGMHG